MELLFLLREEFEVDNLKHAECIYNQKENKPIALVIFRSLPKS